MSFFESSKEESKFKKTEYLKLTEGTHTIRIIQDTGKRYNQHWYGMGVYCLGEECPQCKQNQEIVEEIGGDPYEAYKKASRDRVEGFVARQARGAVNVLDRTPIKICPNCGAENRPVSSTFPAICHECSAAIVDVEPKVTNKIKVFSRTAKVFEQIDDLSKAVLDEKKEPRGIRNFDLLLHVQGNNTIPVPSNNYDEVTFDESLLYDLDKVAIELSPEEMLRKMKGASFSEIFKSRRVDSYNDADEAGVEAPSTEKVAEIESEIKGLF